MSRTSLRKLTAFHRPRFWVKRSYVSLGLIFGLVLLETLCHTYWLRMYDRAWISVLYLGSGMGVGLIPLLWNSPIEKQLSRWTSLLTRIIWLAGISYLCYFLYLKSPWIFNTFPIDIRIADMLPVMRVMGWRWLEGNEIYAEIPEFWGGTFPIYLPAFWMPYVPALYFGFEMRWISEIFIIIGCVFAFRVFDPTSKQHPFSLLAFIPLFLIIRFVMLLDFRLVAISQEGIVIGYYLFLAYTLTTNNPYLQGLAIALCLLSRYVFTFWVPMYLIYIFLFHSKRSALITLGTTVALWMLFMVYTGAIEHLGFFSQMPKVYLEAVQDPLNNWKYRPIFEDSLGMARFFSADSLVWMHRGLFILSFLVPFTLLLINYKRSQPICKEMFALCSLKLTLVVFYNLLIIPALYLFYTNTFFSFAVLFYYANGPSNFEPFKC